jgi:hypothetical protein
MEKLDEFLEYQANESSDFDENKDEKKEDENFNEVTNY